MEGNLFFKSTIIIIYYIIIYSLNTPVHHIGYEYVSVTERTTRRAELLPFLIFCSRLVWDQPTCPAAALLQLSGDTMKLWRDFSSSLPQ